MGKKFKVNLKAVINPDHLPLHALDHVNLEKPTIDYSVECDSLEECSMRCRLFISKHNLGGGEWAGGFVHDSNGKFVGRVSYNGRVWGKDGEIAIGHVAIETEEPKRVSKKAGILKVLELARSARIDYLVERFETSKAVVQSAVSALRKEGRHIIFVNEQYQLIK